MTATTTPRMTPADHANVAYEAVRAINHATITAVLPAPDVYAVLGCLNQVGHGLSQVSTQLASSLVRSLNAYDVYEDDGGDPTTSVFTARYHLAQAAAMAHQLGTHLAHAQNAIARQGHHGRPGDVDADRGDDRANEQAAEQGDPVLW